MAWLPVLASNTNIFCDIFGFARTTNNSRFAILFHRFLGQVMTRAACQFFQEDKVANARKTRTALDDIMEDLAIETESSSTSFEAQLPRVVQ
eukprot:6430819-Amphidinium_carterae.1